MANETADLGSAEIGFVIDSNARPGEVRSHEIIVQMVEGQEPVTRFYNLRSDERTKMPMDHAMQFLRDKAFQVFDAAGNLIKPVPVTDRTDGKLVLGDDQVVAEYDELSREALWKRVKALPGSDKIGKASGNDTLIAFLKAAAKRPTGISRGSEGVKTDGDIPGLVPESQILKKAA